MDELIKRVKKSCGYESQAAVARALNMSPQNFLSRKNSGGIKDSLINLATGQGVNPEWLRTGKGEMRASSQSPDPLIASLLLNIKLLSDRVEAQGQVLLANRVELDKINEAMRATARTGELRYLETAGEGGN